MTQEIIVYIIIGLTIGVTLFLIVKKVLANKKRDENPCNGCDGCELKQFKKADCTK